VVPELVEGNRFMSGSYRATLLPRLLVLLGVLLIALGTFFDVNLLPEPAQTTLGGALALAGIVWFVVVSIRAKR